MWSLAYGITGITAKIASHFYDANLEEYLEIKQLILINQEYWMVFMTATGLIGSLFGVWILIFEVPMEVCKRN